MEQYSVKRVLFFFILTLYTLHIVTSRSSIRPNKLVSYSIPEKRLLKKALGYNEDTYLNFTELATKYKYPTEVHTVTTEDGYILSVFRILPKCSEPAKSYPVLLMHGLFDTADLWILAGTKIGLGYVLADNCYDVWAANSRGNHYSRRHVTLDPNKDPEYWNFTFDENGNFDVPATIDYILEKTRSLKLFYIGHSQGTTTYFTMGSLRPDYSNKVTLAVQLAPVAWLKNLNNPLAVLAARNYEIIQTTLESAGFSELFARDHLEHFVIEFLCQMAPRLCELAFTLTTGYKQGTIPLSTIPVAIGHLLSGGSLKNLAHFAQLIKYGKFQRYDEGKKDNLRRYGSPTPPPYNVSRISSPIVLVAGQNDGLSQLRDVAKLASKLPNLVENYIVPISYWSHHNHIWGFTAPDLVFSKILKYFNQFKTEY
ncbi:gastric triacylglycerol lipase-like [Anticarsia gemmatalis]|uniref:gastric triacylglycerol lipase-like n=1 Tax=Anticarsia gemmatalis TaxID=129554 RepID=UPI003F75FE45